VEVSDDCFIPGKPKVKLYPALIAAKLVTLTVKRSPFAIVDGRVFIVHVT